MTERIQLLDDLGAEFARVAAEAEQKGPRPSGRGTRILPSRVPARMLVAGVGAALLLGGVAYAIPTTRVPIDGVADSFAAWVSGESDQAPGAPVEPADELPEWFTAHGQARRIAKTEGVGLYVRTVDSDEGPWLEFGLGEGAAFSMGATLERWRERFARRKVLVLGSALFGPQDVLDEHGRFPLLGITTRDVARVELRYANGPPLIGRVGDGGYVLLADAWRALTDLIAYDRSGRVLERIDVRSYDGRYLCEKEPGVCPG